MPVTVQMKQRIIGIIVLVFLGLIILPWMFGQNNPDLFNKHEKPPASLPDVVKESGPVSTPVPDPVAAEQQIVAPQPLSGVYTSDQENSPTSAQPTVSDDPASETEMAPAAVMPTKPIPTVAARPKPSELDSSRIAKIEDGIIRTKSVAKPPELVAVKTHPKMKITEELNKPNLAKLKLAVAKNKTANKSKSDRGWLIQLGSFSTKSNADKLIKQLEAKGYHVYGVAAKNSQGDDVTKVVVGPEPDRTQAAGLVTKINKIVHINGIIIKG